MTVSSDIKGSWVTGETRYKDRYIEILEDQIIFGTGQVEPNTLFIIKADKKVKGKLTEWIFSCEDIKGNPIEITLFHNIEGSEDSIKLKNNPTVWIRSGGG